MKAFLMAAGMGTRISAHTHNPKSLLMVGNTSILKHTVTMLLKRNIEVTIILGYKKDCIIDELQGLDVKFYVNPFFKVTNSIASLWFAKNNITNDDILLANADVYWEEDTLDLLLSDEREVVMLADKRRVKEGDYFFKCNDKNELVAYGKELTVENRDCEYVGIAKIKSTFIPTFKARLEELVMNGEYNFWWENVLYSMSDYKKIYIQDIGERFWGEVDTLQDYERVCQYVKSKKK